MKQTKVAYYADLLVYPVILAGLLSLEGELNGFDLVPWWCSVVIGAILWTLVEYLLHRFIYHKMPIIRELHALHHSYPSQLVGSPLWTSMLGFSTFHLVLYQFSDFEIATGTACGLIMGYICYLVIHDAVHRWHLKDNSWIRGLRLRHLRHHRHAVPGGNFGVTSGFWDFVFGTTIRVGGATAEPTSVGRSFHGVCSPNFVKPRR